MKTNNLTLKELLGVVAADDILASGRDRWKVRLPKGSRFSTGEPEAVITGTQAAILSSLEIGGSRALVHWIEETFLCGTPQELYDYRTALPEEPGGRLQYVVSTTFLARRAKYDFLE